MCWSCSLAVRLYCVDVGVVWCGVVCCRVCPVEKVTDAAAPATVLPTWGVWGVNLAAAHMDLCAVHHESDQQFGAVAVEGRVVKLFPTAGLIVLYSVQVIGESVRSHQKPFDFLASS